MRQRVSRAAIDHGAPAANAGGRRLAPTQEARRARLAHRPDPQGLGRRGNAAHQQAAKVSVGQRRLAAAEQFLDHGAVAEALGLARLRSRARSRVGPRRRWSWGGPSGSAHVAITCLVRSAIAVSALATLRRRGPRRGHWSAYAP